MSTHVPTDEIEVIKRARDTSQALRNEIGKRVIGLHEVIDHLLICMMGGGHALLVGVPGLAKTLLIRTVAQAMHLNFRRIQFTPDLMPSDITGTDIIEEDHTTGRREFVFVKGPLFANIILADEINRAPPKTQAALLEAMQEHSVTVSGKTYHLEEPFFVLATQNPIEQEGTYPLPEAQLDRFMLHLELDYPSYDEEIQVLRTTTGGDPEPVRALVSGEDIIQFQRALRKIPVPNEVLQYVVHLVQATRPFSKFATDEIKKYVRFGAGPRASQQLIFSAKVRAVFEGRFHVEIEDIKALALSTLRHRVLLNYHAEAERVTIRDIIQKLASDVH